MNISGEVVRTSQLPKKTLGLNDSLVALMSSPLETVTVPVSDFVSFVATQLLTASADSLDSVTTVGNTTANTITIGGATSPYYQLNTLSPGTQAVGRFVWNDVDGTVDLGLKGGNVTLQVGQETVVRVVNKTNANLLESEYKVVRVRIASEGGAQGQRLAVVLAQGNNDPDSVTTLGIVTENINNNQEGFITVFGNVSGINTTGSLQGETWADGDVLFLSPTTPGSLTKVKPVAPNHTVIMGYVVYAHQNNGKIFVKVDNGYELEELHDVLPTPYVNNGVLYRDTTANLWRSATISTLLGGTPLLTVPTLSQVTTAGNTTTNAITTGGLTVNTNLIYTDTVNGRVGVGTTTPTQRVEVISFDATIRMGAGYLNSTPAITLINNGASTYKAASLFTGQSYSGFLFDNSGTMRFGSAAKTAFTSNLVANSSETYIMTLVGATSNVLIGTTTDAGYKLDVNGTLRINSSIFGQGTTNTYYQIANSDYHHRFFTRTDVGAALERFTIEGGAVSGKAYFQNTNVGIGTTTPSALLEISHATSNGDSGLLKVIGTGATTNANFALQTIGGTGLYQLDYAGNMVFRSQQGGLFFDNSGTGNINFRTTSGQISRMIVLNNGNIGIGTTSPASRLTVLNSSNTVAAIIGGGTSTPGWVGIGTVNSGALPIIQGYNNAVNVSNTISLNPSGGNVLIGTATDAGFKLDVNGTTRIQGTTTITPAADTSAIVSTGYSVTGSGTTPLIDLSGTWNTTGTPTLIKANLTDTASNASSFLIDLQVAGSSQFRVRKDGYARASQGFVIGTSNGNDLVSSSGGESYVAGGLFTSLRFASSSTEGYGLTISGFNASTRTNTSGAAGVLQLAHGFAPTSGVGTFIGLLYRGTINQTGGASGVTRGLYVNPTLTAAADWRSIEWSNNTGWGLYGAGTAPNYLGGSLVLGTTTVNTSALLQVESTTKGFLPPRMTTAQILLISSPAEGLQVYNTDLKTICFYNGTAWQRVTSTAM